MIWLGVAIYIACGCLFLVWVCSDRHDPCVFRRDWRDMLGLMLACWVVVAVGITVSVIADWTARIVDRVRG